jgi:hypothetical protein
MGHNDTRDVERLHTAEEHNQRHSHASAEAPRPSRPSHRAGAMRLVLVLGFAAAACTAPSQAGAFRDVSVPRGPWINRTLMGGAARDLSTLELKAVNRARGIAFPR